MVLGHHHICQIKFIWKTPGTQSVSIIGLLQIMKHDSAEPYVPSTCIRPRKIMCVSGFPSDNIQICCFYWSEQKNTKKIMTLNPIIRDQKYIHFLRFS